EVSVIILDTQSLLQALHSTSRQLYSRLQSPIIHILIPQVTALGCGEQMIVATPASPPALDYLQRHSSQRDRAALAALSYIRIANPVVDRALSAPNRQPVPRHVTTTESRQLPEPQTRQCQEDEHLRVVLRRASRNPEHLTHAQAVRPHVRILTLRQLPKVRLHGVRRNISADRIRHQTRELTHALSLTAGRTELPELHPLPDSPIRNRRQRSVPPPRLNDGTIDAVIRLKSIPRRAVIPTATRPAQEANPLPMKLTDGHLLSLRRIHIR